MKVLLLLLLLSTSFSKEAPYEKTLSAIDLTLTECLVMEQKVGELAKLFTGPLVIQMVFYNQRLDTSVLLDKLLMFTVLMRSLIRGRQSLYDSLYEAKVYLKRLGKEKAKEVKMLPNESKILGVLKDTVDLLSRVEVSYNETKELLYYLVQEEKKR